jgi:hypothetical protein
MEYEKQILLEDMELLNEGKDNNKESSDEFNRKLKHKRKHMKISYDDEENENIMYIENNKNDLDDSYIPQDLNIFTNQVKEVGEKSGVVPDTILKQTLISDCTPPERIKEKLNEKILNPN